MSWFLALLQRIAALPLPGDWTTAVRERALVARREKAGSAGWRSRGYWRIFVGLVLLLGRVGLGGTALRGSSWGGDWKERVLRFIIVAAFFLRQDWSRGATETLEIGVFFIGRYWLGVYLGLSRSALAWIE